jgi:hypothetical protein
MRFSWNIFTLRGRSPPELGSKFSISDFFVQNLKKMLMKMNSNKFNEPIRNMMRSSETTSEPLQITHSFPVSVSVSKLFGFTTKLRGHLLSLENFHATLGLLDHLGSKCILSPLYRSLGLILVPCVTGTKTNQPTVGQIRPFRAFRPFNKVVWSDQLDKNPCITR